MSKSQILRLHEIRKIHELIARISEFGDQPQIWRRIALEGLIDLLGGNVGLTVDICITPQGVPQPIDMIDIGWDTESARRRFGEYITSGEMATDPSLIKLLEVQQRQRFMTRRRRELVDDASWYSSPTVSEARRSADVDDFLVTTAALRPNTMNGLIIYRRWHDRPFEPRHRRILQLFQLELIRAMRDSAQPRPIFGPLPHLSARLKQTLELMFTPMSLKEMADHLQLSRHTINDYQKALYRLFGVSSRPALLSQFRPIKRQIRFPVPS